MIYNCYEFPLMGRDLKPRHVNLLEDEPELREEPLHFRARRRGVLLPRAAPRSAARGRRGFRIFLSCVLFHTLRFILNFFFNQEPPATENERGVLMRRACARTLSPRGYLLPKHRFQPTPSRLCGLALAPAHVSRSAKSRGT